MTDKPTRKNEEIPEELNKTESFINKHKDKISYIGIGLLIIIGAIWSYKNLYLEPAKEESQIAIYMAQTYFEMDSLDLALNGDGNYLGFLEIIDKHGWTTVGNLSYYYAGLCYLYKGEFKLAIEYLKEFDSDDLILSTEALAAIGDAYMELEDFKHGIDYYQKAAKHAENEFLTPILLKKLGMAFEKTEKLEDAKETFELLKENYPTSHEGMEADKYIARLTAKM